MTPTPDQDSDTFDELEIDSDVEVEGYTDDNAYHSLLERTGSTLHSAFFNMTNSIVGAGIVGVPKAFKNMGLAAGLLLLALLALLNDWTLRLIILNTKLSGEKTYTGFVSHNYGNLGKLAVLLSQGLFAFGGTVGFAVIIGDSIPHVMRSIFKEAVDSSKVVDFLLSRNTIIVLSICCCSYPLSLTRDISRLAKASGLALIGMLLIITIVAVRAPQMDTKLKGDISGWGWLVQSGLFKGISVISFAMVCHHNTTFIYDSIEKPTMDRFDTVIHTSCVVATVLCCIMGLSGYLNFGSLTKGNILNNFPGNDVVVNIARFCFGLNMLTTFPLEIYVVREVVKDLLSVYYQHKLGDSSYKIESLSSSQHIAITSVVSFLPMFISLFTCNLGAVLELVGATSASMIAYILPPLCYDKMTKSGKSWRDRLPALSCVVFGFLVMFISSYQTLSESAKGGNSGHCVD